MGVRLLTLLCVLQTLSLSLAVSELTALQSSLQRNSTAIEQTWQCSESWCNGSLTCSEIYGDSCPPGLLCKDGLCECPNQYPHMITCDNASLLVHSGFCVTYDEKRRNILVGSCVYSSDTFYIKDGNFSIVSGIFPMSIKNTVCNSYSRTGALCGSCLPDHYPLAYSFNMTCIPCPHACWNWFRYIMAAYLPLTLFYLLILFFKINTTTSHLFAVVYLCQLLSLPIMAQDMFTAIATLENKYYLRMVEFIFSLYGIWNLDFFRPFYTDLCLGIGILPTLALDYVIAVYPLFLMIITYLLIVLNDENYRAISIIWRPFKILFALLKNNWDIKTSLIDAFSTFFFLSNIKFLSVSFALLCPVKLYHLHGDQYNYTLGLYYAADIEYFGSEHLPYAILAIAVLCVFVILPITVLSLYPCGFFRKFLNLFPVRLYILINTFMDSFQGCYKDGTEPGTRDCRWFVSFFLIVRIFLFLSYSLLTVRLCIVLASIVLIIGTAFLTIFQPFKQAVAHFNTINTVSLQFITLFMTVFNGGYISSLSVTSLENYFFVLVNILAVLPQVYMFGSVLYWIYSSRLFGLGVMQRLKAWKNGYDLLDKGNDNLPDRIENSGAYPRENLANFVSITT